MENEDYYIHPSDLKEALIELHENDCGKGLLDQGKLQEGGMGAIYKVYDKSLKRMMAMKVMGSELKQEDQKIIQFIEEARITAQLEHPNIIPIHSAGFTSDNQIFFTMKLVNGEALNEVIKKIGLDVEGYSEKYDQFNLLLIFRKICDALSYSHSKNIVHRDIKPENIMVGEYGEVLLMDWGIAKYLGSKPNEEEDIYSNRSNGSFQTTLFGIIKGSPAYMSPEQAKAEEDNFDKFSDIFLMGATLYHMMTGRPPYISESMDQMIIDAENCNFPPPQEVAPEAQIPDELSDIILKAMSPKQEDRFQSVYEMADAIDDLLAGRVSSCTKDFAKGEQILHYGDKGDEAFVITKGSVEVFRTINGQKSTYSKLEAGDIFGELSAITEALRSADVVALEDTSCIVVNSDILGKQMRKLPPWFSKILNAQIKRQRVTDKIVHPLLVTDCSYEVLNQLRMMFMCYSTVNEEGLLTMPMQETVKEISCSIKIPEEKIRSVIAAVSEERILKINDLLEISVTAWELFSDFVDFCKNLPSQGTTTTSRISKIDIHKIYTDGSSVMLRHSRLGLHEEPGKLGKLRPLSKSLSESERIEIRQDFSDTLTRIKNYGKTASTLNDEYFSTVRDTTNQCSKPPKISQNFCPPPA